ncbi:MAG: hypothetical protein ABI128_13010 [Rhodanobacter sp.]
MGTSFAALAGMGMFAILVMIVVGILLGALILAVSFRLVVGFMPSYLRALGAVLLTYIAVLVVSLILGMLIHSSVLTLIVNFLVGAAVVNYLLLAADGRQIGFGKACVVELVNMVIGFVLALIIFAIFAMMFGTAMLGLH